MKEKRPEVAVIKSSTTYDVAEAGVEATISVEHADTSNDGITISLSKEPCFLAEWVALAHFILDFEKGVAIDRDEEGDKDEDDNEDDNEG